MKSGVKYLITGGAGFIGANLVKDLVKRGEEVLVIDNLSTGNLENLKEVINKVISFKANSAESLNISEIKGLKGIFHLGIPSSSPMYKENHFLIGGSINEFLGILELCRRENCKLVYASSSSLYNGNQPPFKEEMDIMPSDYYSEARYAMERLAEMYSKLYGVQAIGLRLFSVYGKGEEYKGKYANLASQFLWSMQKGEAPLIYGDGNQARDFIFVEDVVKAFILAMESETKSDIFNVGRGESHTLNQLVDILQKILNTSLKPAYFQNPIKNYVFHTLADTAKTEDILGFKAMYSLEQGIKEILASE